MRRSGLRQGWKMWNLYVVFRGMEMEEQHFKRLQKAAGSFPRLAKWFGMQSGVMYFIRLENSTSCDSKFYILCQFREKIAIRNIPKKHVSHQKNIHVYHSMAFQYSASRFLCSSASFLYSSPIPNLIISSVKAPSRSGFSELKSLAPVKSRWPKTTSRYSWSRSPKIK